MLDFIFSLNFFLLLVIQFVGFVITVYLDHALTAQAPVWKPALRDTQQWAALAKDFFIWPFKLVVCMYETHKHYG